MAKTFLQMTGADGGVLTVDRMDDGRVEIVVVSGDETSGVSLDPLEQAAVFRALGNALASSLGRFADEAREALKTGDASP